MPVTVTITNDTTDPVTVTLSVGAAPPPAADAKGDTGRRKGKLLVLQRSAPGDNGWTDLPGAYGIVGPDDDVRVDVREGPYC